jgi:CRISPR-associated protein Cas2
MSELRLNAYHIMWLFVFFDLPVTSKKHMKEAALFRKNLERDGFVMMQFSVYIRHCASRESMDVHIKRIKAVMPSEGRVSILAVTDRQFSEIHNFWGQPKSIKTSKIKERNISAPVQLELF